MMQARTFIAPCVKPTDMQSIEHRRQPQLVTPERKGNLLASDAVAKVSEMTTGIQTFGCGASSGPLRSGITEANLR